MGFLAFGVDLGIAEAIQMYFVSITLGALSFLPGGIGVVEGSLIGTLTTLGINLSVASSLVLFIRFTTIWFATGLGFVAMHSMTKRLAN